MHRTSSGFSGISPPCLNLHSRFRVVPFCICFEEPSTLNSVLRGSEWFTQTDTELFASQLVVSSLGEHFSHYLRDKSKSAELRAKAVCCIADISRAGAAHFKYVNQVLLQPAQHAALAHHEQSEDSAVEKRLVHRINLVLRS